MVEKSSLNDVLLEDAALEKIIEIIKILLKSVLFNKDNTINIDFRECCCPKLIKFKVLGSTVIIINDNAECQNELLPSSD